MADLMGDAEDLEGAPAPDLEHVEFIGLLAGAGREVDDTAFVGVAFELPVKTGPAFGLDLALEGAADVVVGAGAELLSDEISFIETWRETNAYDPRVGLFEEVSK